MYKNKKDVDKYVENLLSKHSAKDFKTRAYSIARLYFDVGDYTSCQKYVEQYLSQKENNAAAYKLLGQALQKLGQKDKALEQFKTSLEIDPTQTSTILDICEILADQDVHIEPGRANYWCEKAEAIFPRNPITFRLREKLVSLSNTDPEVLVELLKAELKVRPKDAALHGRLLKHYINTNNYKEAFEHSCQVEFSTDNFINHYSWYETLDELLKNDLESTCDWLFQLLLLTVKERLCVLSLTEVPSGSSKSLVETCQLLHSYDQALERISKNPLPGFVEFHKSLLQHHRGQLVFHVATYLLKKAKKNQMGWREALTTAAPFMLLAWQTIPLDTNIKWVKNVSEKQLVAVNRWYIEGTYRCSQSGHFLISNFQDKSQAYLDQVGQHCSGIHWKDKLYEKIFTNESNSSSKKSSFLVSNAVTAPILKLPRKAEVMAYDDDAQRQHGNSLHHFVWTLLNYKCYADFKCTLFEMLNPTAAVLGPEALNKFDIYAFLYCATLTSQQNKPDKISYVTEKPTIIPANITDLLCPLPQMKWWDCAYKFSQNLLGTELTDIRATLSRGIEVVRCVDNHGLDPELLCNLGRIFSELAKKSTVIGDKTYAEKRAYLYFGSAIPLLEKLKSKTMIKVSDKRLFDYTHKEELTVRELNSLLEECKLSVAVNHLNENEYDRVIELLVNIKSPQAYYHLAYTYKKISMDENNSAVLDKAKKIAFKALDALKDTESYKTNPLYSEIQNLIEDIEMQANRVDLDSSDNLNDIDGKYSSDENISFRTAPTKTNRQIFRNISSTPKANQNANNTNYKTAIDSHVLEMTRLDQQHLERIESEIKNLQKRDSHIETFMDQTKDWFDENRKLGQQIMTTINSNIQNTTDQFKLLKISVDQVKDQIDECRNECKDVGELKKQIAELKKEVNKLKKSSSEQAIDESDLYNLDDDYRTNDSASTYAAQLPFASQVLPPFAQRPPFPIPPNPYQLYNQNLYNLYNQYTQFAQSSSVPGASQLFDATRAQMNFPGVYPNPDQMFLDVAHLIPPTVPPAPIVTVVPTMPVVVLSSVSTVPIISAPTLATSTTFKTNTTTSTDSKDLPRSLPVNVVITSSDPLPTHVSTPAPVLSVTIPQKHIKGTPHNYQITMPTVTETPPVFSFTMPDNKLNKTPTSLSNWKQNFQPFNTVYNSIETSTSVVDGPFSTGSPNTSLNKSRTLSEKSNTSVENYDPCPDFKPIVPLPDEVKVTTGEEDEIIVFSSRAKLFRFDDKQWKERGIGEMKLLKHKITGKVRVLMRREQVHKICANHLITPEMEIKLMKNETKAYMWVANDFADEKLTLEKFCIRFKTVELAKQFFEAFEKARLEATSSPNTSVTETKDIQQVSKPSSIVSSTTTSTTVFQGTKTMIGGFSFSSAPIFKTIENDNKPELKTIETTTSKPNIFSSLTFKTGSSTPFSNLFNPVVNSPKIEHKQDTDKNKLNSSDTVEEFEPNVEFKPVVPLPALIDQKTGEEDEIILFEHRAKLLRFDSVSKEWKERGLGNIKILLHKNNNQKVRLLMRREQIMKVCCNHSLTKEMTFQKMPNIDKAVTWCAKDFSEGELVAETFCLRFKTVQICDEFIEAIKTAQTKMQDDTKAAKEEQNAAKQVGQNKLSKPQVPAGEVNSNTTSSSGWGDKFKPKPGSWECQACFVRNVANLENCNACNSPKDPNAKKNTCSSVTESNLPKFTFGIPAKKVEQPNEKPTDTGFGDKFKPKEGSWECKQCFVRNDSAQNNCCACNSARNPDLAKDQKDGVPSSTKFQFGIPLTQNNDDKTKLVSSIFDGTGGQKFSFGIPSHTAKEKELLNDQKPKSTIFGTSQIIDGAGPINLSKTVTKPPLLSTPQTGPLSDSIETKKFDFVFKPTTETGNSTETKSEKNQPKEDSDDEYVKEEDCSAHFTPVIPMPDKVDVVTGEENEIELFAHRAKLYVFSDVEWKERGLGIVKLLKHKETNKLRVVMRREQVLKICLNHALAPEILYTPKDEKSWLFAASDFSEGQISFHQFCLRFGKKEVALEFKKAIDNARQEQTGNIVKSNNTNLEKDTEDVVFVTEIQATDEEKRKAKELMLPENFYTYKTKDPCQGCRGCEVDDKSEKSTSQSEKPSISGNFGAASVATPLKSTGPNILSPTNSMYGTPGTGNTDRTFDTSIFRTPLGSVGSQTLTLTNTTQDVTISDTNKENIFSQTPSIFRSFSEQNSIFGTPQSKSFTMFGSGDSQTPVSSKSALIAPPKLSAQTTSVEKKTSETTPTSIFNSEQVKPAFGEGTSIFGGSGVSSNKSIFGFTADKPKDNAKSENKSIFGGGDQKPIGTGLFGNTNQGSIFGSNNLNQNTTQSLVCMAAPQNTQNVFKSIFANNTIQGSIWDSGSDSNQRTNLTVTPALETQSAEPKEPLFLQKAENNLSFASFASSEPATFQKKEDFQWEGAGQQLFKLKPKDSNNSKDDSASGAADEEYDPHYEPIVPLPDEIVVTTGEEEEEKVFGERAKLYRYDDKAREWKERGVGEMKILYHPQRNSYRLLLRREQVHKAVLNMLVYTELELLPMKNSDQAWTWIGRNFAEIPAGEQETLAVRFKTAVLANQFREKVIQCVRKLQAAAATAIREQKEAEEKPSSGIALLRLPKHLGTAARADSIIATAVAKETQETPTEAKANGGENKQVHFEEHREDEHDYDEDDDDEDDEDHEYDEDDYNEDDEENAAYYTCDGEVVIQQDVQETSCGNAHILVMFDHDMCSPKILVTDGNTGEILADMLIHTDTEFQMVGDKVCKWSGTDYTTNEPVDKTITVKFYDSDTLMEFYDSCETSKAATYSSNDPES